MRRGQKQVGVLLAGVLVWTFLTAFTDTILPSGVPLRWLGGAKINFAANTSNTTGLTDQQIFQAAVRGLQRWRSGSGGAASFDYWQGTDRGTYEPNSNYNGLSSLYFASAHSTGQAPVSGGVIGLTQVWYDTSNGKILETDVVLNDIHFQLTTDPHDTTGEGSGYYGSGGGRPRVYIENVLTHELGHAYGMGHSAALQSTMLFVEAPEQAHLSCDDQVGVRAKYGTLPGSGMISGTVLSQSGTPVFGAHVLAISRRRGVVMTSALTDTGGRYVLYSLEPGTYHLMVEPNYAGGTALPAFYSGVETRICGGAQFTRTWLMQPTGFDLLPVQVAAGSTASVPTITARCTQQSGSGGSSPAINVASGAAVMDRFTAAGQTYTYRLDGAQGDLEVRALAFSLYSPVRLTLELLNSGGQVISTQKAQPIYIGDSGYVNHDAALIAQALPASTYYLRVSGSPLNLSFYPAGRYALDSSPFFALTFTRNESQPALAQSLAFNGRCRMDENFAAYSSPGGSPPRSNGRGQQNEERKSVGFCGTLGDGADLPPPDPGQIVGWMLPWLFLASVFGSRRLVKHRIT